MRRSQRLRALYTDHRRDNFLFDNLHHRETAPAGGRPKAHAGLALLAAAEWCVGSGVAGERVGLPPAGAAAAGLPEASCQLLACKHGPAFIRIDHL